MLNGPIAELERIKVQLAAFQERYEKLLEYTKGLEERVYPLLHIKEADDWMAVYRNGEKVYETHSCSLQQGLRALGIPYTSEEDEEGLQETGRYPNTI